MNSSTHQYLMHATYFAPRGKHRLQGLGNHLSQRYISPNDNIIGFIGDSGAGKSILIRGIFPGLELTNDDEGINVRPLPLLHQYQKGHFRSHTYHLDVRFESAFTQTWELAEAIKEAVSQGKRVIVEHFDLLYPHLGFNAEVLIGVGEEVIITRPGVFGPEAKEIGDIVFNSIKYRKMAHTAEDLTSLVLMDMGFDRPTYHSDIKHGFVLEFKTKPNIDLIELEQKVKELIDANLSISHHDDEHINIGEDIVFPCTGPRIHVKKTGDISGFYLIKDFKWDTLNQQYLLAGLIGSEQSGLELLK
ncbi:alanine-tRNA synthetase second additional domain-containing protein [Proteinivorax tanatarense]|uniref:Alanine-tRNA synthetase second additional domain-containing protein n=1 Tax=Proteinivorax tanatarense TaxID=1260629 RepID=A0AAU7VIG7_9FIRM